MDIEKIKEAMESIKDEIKIREDNKKQNKFLGNTFLPRTEHLQTLFELARLVIEASDEMPKEKCVWVEKGRFCDSPYDNRCTYLHLLNNNKSASNPKSRCNKCQYLLTNITHDVSDYDKGYNQGRMDMLAYHLKKMLEKDEDCKMYLEVDGEKINHQIDIIKEQQEKIAELVDKRILSEKEWADKCISLELRIKNLEKALRNIIESHDDCNQDEGCKMVNIAKQALEEK